eukprot:g1784.t1
MNLVACALALWAWGPEPGFPNSLGATPMRGWRSWQAVGGGVDQAAMERAMHGLRRCGLADVGYTDVGLDGGYFDAGAGVGGSCHDEDGHMIVDTAKFPSLRNMTRLAHALNLTASWYLSADGCKGPVEKAAWPQGTYATDVADAVAYGFDGVKFDSEAGGPVHNITEWAVRLNATGRAMVIENCMEKHPAYLLADPARCPYNFYRAGPDNAPHFLSSVSKVYHYLTDFLPPRASPASPAAAAGTGSGGGVRASLQASRPGCFAYADMLSIGAPIAGTPIHQAASARGCANMTLDEERTLFSLWCAVSSPLVLGFDVADDAVVARYWHIVANERALAINAAWAGEAGRLLKEAPPSDPAALENVTVFDGTACEVAHNGTGGQVVNRFPAWVIYSKRLPAGAVAVIAIRLGAPVAGSATLELTAEELAQAAGTGRPTARSAGSGAEAGPTAFEAMDVWTAARGALVTAAAPWRPEVGARNSTFVVFRPV